MEKAFGGASLSNSEVRERVQDVCEFEPPVALEWLVVRFIKTAPKPLEWVSQTRSTNGSLKSRIRRRVVATDEVLIEKVERVNLVDGDVGNRTCGLRRWETL